MKTSGSFILKGIIAVALIFSANALYAQDYGEATASGETVVDVINNSEDHTILASLLEETMLTETLAQPQGTFTVLAPTDEAFMEVEEALNQLRGNPEQLQQVVLNHLFQGMASADDVEDALELNIEQGDIQASNGLVHVIDQVIVQ